MQGLATIERVLNVAGYLWNSAGYVLHGVWYCGVIRLLLYYFGQAQL